MEKLLISMILFILGSIMGSFLGCMGYRIPNKIKTTYPGSFCPKCKKSLKWFMNIPIISYIVQKGRCIYCKEKIGFIYFFTEVLCGLLFVINYLVFDFTIDFYISTIISCALIVTIISDFLYYYISDRVIVISWILILITLFYFLPSSDVIMRIVISIVSFLFMYGIKILGNSMFERESLGDGDIKLMAVIGLALGLLGTLISLVFASIIGLIFSIILIKKYKEGIIPFGPFLLIGCLLVLYLSKIILPYMEKLLSL